MDRFIEAVRTRGFKRMKDRGSSFRANRLFKRDGDDTITVQVEVNDFARHRHGFAPNAHVSVFSTSYSGRRGRRKAHDHYMIQGWGNRSNGQTPGYEITFGTFGDTEQARVLRMIDSALAFVEQEFEEERVVAEQWEREKPQGYDTWDAVDQIRAYGKWARERKAALAAQEG